MKYIVVQSTGDLDRCLGVYDTPETAYGTIMCEAMRFDSNFTVKAEHDSNYNAWFSVGISYTKTDEHAALTDYYTVYFLREEKEHEAGRDQSEPEPPRPV